MKTTKRLAAGRRPARGRLPPGRRAVPRQGRGERRRWGAALGDATITITTPNLTTFKLGGQDGRQGQVRRPAPATARCRTTSSSRRRATWRYEVDKKIPIGDIGTVDAKLTSKSEAQAKAATAVRRAEDVFERAGRHRRSTRASRRSRPATRPRAEAKFLEAVKKNPDLPAGWQALAQLAYEKKDWAKAIEYGQKATDLDPSLTNAVRR